MELLEKLKVLDKYAGTDSDKFIEHLSSLLAEYPTEEEKKLITEYAEKALGEVAKRVDDFIKETSLKVQLAEISQIVSMSYIAKNYFKKTRQWLYQKINGSLVNGNPSKFTENELDTLNFAIQDISKKLGSTIISL